jgi:hypothetical protein
MGKKLIITTEQYSKLIEKLEEETTKKVLSEGTFQNIKNILSILSKKKGIANNQNSLSNISSQIIKDLDSDIRQTDPDFPNSKDNTLFLNTILQINAVYETVHGAAYLPPTEDGYLTPIAANEIINELKLYITKIKDTNLNRIYKTVAEADFPAIVNQKLGIKNPNPVKSNKLQGKNSRLIILTNLLGSMINVDPTDLPKHITPPNPTTSSTKNAPRGTFRPEFQDIYNSSLSLFKFIINNRKLLGVRSNNRVGTGLAIDKMMKVGDKRNYKGKEVEIVRLNSAPNKTQVKYPHSKGLFAVNTNELQKLNQISEGKYIINPESISYLEKVTSTDKLKQFETLIGLVDNIRIKIKNLKPTRIDAKFDSIISRFRSNPIMLTDFQKMFSISSDDEAQLKAYKIFMDEILLAVYSGNLDKLIKFAGGLNKVNESEYNTIDPSKAFITDAQDKRAFKKNLIKFLSLLFELFMHLWNLKNPKKIKP